MIDELKQIPISMYKDLPNKEDCVEIKRQGLAPKGKYCDKCYYFNIELEPRINPWNDEVERTVNVGKCNFFGERLMEEESTLPCGEKYNKYIKCISCFVQTDKDCIEFEKKNGMSVKEFYINLLLANFMGKDNEK